MAVGLLSLADGLGPVHKDALPVMAVFLPTPTTPGHRVQWPLPPPSGQQGSAGTSQQLSVPCLCSLSSKHSRHEAYVLFSNTTQHTMRLMWCSYKGEETGYDTLLPGHSCIQQTFATHPWVAREVHTATRLPINMQEAFCVHRTQQPRPQARAVAPAAAAPAPAGPPQGEAAAAAAPADDQAGGQQPQQQQQAPQQQQQHQEQFFSFQGPTGVRRVPVSCLQRATISLLPALPWSEAAHSHFPPAFKAAVRAFLLCHQQLQQAAQQAGAHCERGVDGSGSAGLQQGWDGSGSGSGSHLGCLPSVLLPHIVRLAAPYAPQHMDLPLPLRPDILPTCLPEDPEAADNEWDDPSEQLEQQQQEEEEGEEQEGGEEEGDGGEDLAVEGGAGAMAYVALMD